MPARKPSGSSLARNAWIGFFLLWILFLSGLFKTWTKTPGIIQAVQLKNHLDQKKAILAGLEADLAAILDEQKAYREDSKIQEQEIRQTLGYAAKDEIIFEFGSARNP